MKKTRAISIFEELKGETPPSAKIDAIKQKDGYLVIRTKQYHEFSTPTNEILHVKESEVVERSRVIAKVLKNKIVKL